MKTLALLGSCIAAIGGGLWGARPIASPSASVTVVIGGNIRGYIAPCGCTSPMTGGIDRLGTLVKAEPVGTIFIENSDLVAPGDGLLAAKQNVLKAEALAETFGALGASAVAIGTAEGRLGEGTVDTLARLAHHRAICTNLVPAPYNNLKQWEQSGPFLIGAVSPHASELALAQDTTALSPVEAAKQLVSEAESEGLKPIILAAGDEAFAQSLANACPEVKLIVFQSQGEPTQHLELAGSTVLVSPGDRGQRVLTLTYNGEFQSLQVNTLSPNFKADEQVHAIYSSYLHRVTQAHLLDLWPRAKTAAYAGSDACAKCHAKAQAVWIHSAHATALASLVQVGHQADPDCVECHVTGLSSLLGYRSLRLTPHLANVTCESCHGPSLLHTQNPKLFRLPKISEQTCLGCHTADNSPRFNFATYWPKIKH